MMLIIFYSFTGKRSDTVDLIGVLIPKLRYSYWASWQTLNFMYIVFTALRITTLFLFRTCTCSSCITTTFQTFWELFTASKGLRICHQEYYFYCVISINDRNVDSQASLKMSELGRGSRFWSESLNEDKKDSLGATRPHALSPLSSYLSIYEISPATGKGKLPVCKWVTSNESPSFQCKINVTSNLRSLHHSLFPPEVPTRPQGVSGQLPPGLSSNEHYCGDDNDDDYGSFFFPFNFVNLIALWLY